MTHERSAVVLLSGGLDSAVALAVARDRGLVCRCLSFDYGQRHRYELSAAEAVAASLGAVEHHVHRVDTGLFRGSALTDNSIDVPRDRDEATMSEGIPVTYVPARNLLFLSVAVAFAESTGAESVFIGVNAVDYSGYPDCRPEFIDAFAAAAALGTKAGVDGRAISIATPLVSLTKAEIIALGDGLGVDFGLTSSCYAPDEAGRACGSCDSCSIRRTGFLAAGVADPTRYARAGG